MALAVRSDLSIENQVTARGATWLDRQAVARDPVALGQVTARETGMSFGSWHQQLMVMLAVGRLAEGVAIQQVAADLGYESVPSFVTMFRKTLGAAPGRYMAARQAG